MVFIIDKLKYDTDKLELISKKCEYSYNPLKTALGYNISRTSEQTKLYKSAKGNWLLTYKADYGTGGVAITEKKAEELLLKYDLPVYEKIFGELEEA